MTLAERTRAAATTAPAVGRSRRTLADELRLALADDIVRGMLVPGAALDETELARRFGVSRTPVREAIRQLAASGLVEVRAHRGAVVARPSDERLLGMFEAMAASWRIASRTPVRDTPKRRASSVSSRAAPGRSRPRTMSSASVRRSSSAKVRRLRPTTGAVVAAARVRSTSVIAHALRDRRRRSCSHAPPRCASRPQTGPRSASGGPPCLGRPRGETASKRRPRPAHRS